MTLTTFTIAMTCHTACDVRSIIGLSETKEFLNATFLKHFFNKQGEHFVNFFFYSNEKGVPHSINKKNEGEVYPLLHFLNGADLRTRTEDLPLTRRLLYQLS